MAKTKEAKEFAPYEWAQNDLKLIYAKQYVAQREENGQAKFENEEEREAAVRARYVELKGHIKGDKPVRPRVKGNTFGGVSTTDDDEDDD